MFHNNIEKKLASLIPTGKENAISMKALANLLDISDRDLRRLITRVRVSKLIICGTNYGYYYPADDGELREYRNYLSQRYNTTGCILNIVNDSLNEKGDEFEDE